MVGHDDGVVLSIAGIGTVVNAPGPTGRVETPFNVPNSGTADEFNFTLDYAESCGGPADLIFAVNDQNLGAVPEPATVALMGHRDAHAPGFRGQGASVADARH
ncbi:MAG: hypothetical protein ACRD01_09600 [Terriglobales bacterium]